MFYDLYDERVKGIKYAYEPERVQIINEHEVDFLGRHTIHNLHRSGHDWACNCAKYALFSQSGYTPFCAHVIATEKILLSREP